MIMHYYIKLDLKINILTIITKKTMLDNSEKLSESRIYIVGFLFSSKVNVTKSTSKNFHYKT